MVLFTELESTRGGADKGQGKREITEFSLNTSEFGNILVDNQEAIRWVVLELRRLT